MKKLEFEKGAITPFWIKDIEYMQNGFEEVLNGICSSFMPLYNNFLVVSGCSIKIDKESVNVSNGWVFYNGELYPVRGTTMSCKVSDPIIYLNKNQNYDTSGRRIIVLNDDSQNRDLYRDDYLELSLTKTTDSIGGIKKGAWNLFERILQQSRMKEDEWESAHIVFEGSNSDEDTKIRYKRIGNIVQLSGKIKSNAFREAYVPRPLADINFNRVSNIDGAENRIIKIESSNGILTVNPPSNNELLLDDIMYLVTPEYSDSDGHILV